MGKNTKIIKNHPKQTGELLDIIRDIQARDGFVSDEAVEEVARYLNLSEVEVRGVVTFYHFFSLRPRGRVTVYLNDSITSRLKGRRQVAEAFEQEAGCRFGEVDAGGGLGLFPTSCVGMNDQEPAALIDGVVFTGLTPDKARAIVRGLRDGRTAREMAERTGDLNQSELFRSMISGSVRQRGPVLFAPFHSGAAVARIASMAPAEVIAEIKRSGLMGRGGAGFPTGLKWELCRKSEAPMHFVACNADEGEPGTFKDRGILTELPRLVFEGMAIAGYAVGADEGILYLRGEYAYLKEYLDGILEELRGSGVLGKGIAGNPAFNFDIKIKLGAGAYVCGEESALLESAEGKRGEPRDRPPYPVQVGYLDQPTTVNNVETLAAAARIMVEGPEWFKAMGTPTSAGTKLLSVSGDCERPGIYEVMFGTTLKEVLDLAGAADAAAVQVGGPSGNCIAPSGFDRRICFEDLATGGSVIVFGPDRDLFEVVENFMDFFIDESCGKCTPCRVGNKLLRIKLDKVARGKGTEADLRELQELGRMIKASSRCGLGQSSPNPILTTMQNFQELYRARIDQGADYIADFDLAEAMKPCLESAGRACPKAEQEHD